MKYTELKSAIKKLWAAGYKKRWPGYVKVFHLNDLRYAQAISIEDAVYYKNELNELLGYKEKIAYEKLRNARVV